MNRRSTTIETLFASSAIQAGRNTLFACAIVLLHHSVISAGTIAVNDEMSLRTAFDTASDGDEIVLAPGTYRGRFTATGMTGVTIRSADPMNRAIISAAGVGEAIKLSSAERVTLKDLIIEKAGVNAINIDDGGFVSLSRQITIQNLLLREGTGHGIKFAGVDGFHIEHVEVIGWGSGDVAIDLVGAHDGLVERSFLMNTAPGSGVGVQVKGGCSDVTIRANRFVNANERSIQIGGSTGLAFFRPQPPGDVEASDIVAEGNTILNNGRAVLPSIRAAVSFINTKDGVFRNNVVIRPTGYVARILKENRSPGFVDTQGGEVSDNIIIWESGDIWDAVNVGSNTDAASFHFAGNQWYNRANPSQSGVTLPSEEVGGTYGVDPGVTELSLADWPFDWGNWVVNTTNLDLPYDIDPADGLMLATPAEGAELDLGQSNPLIGDWTYTPINQPTITIPAFSYTLLMRRATPGDFNGNGMLDVTDIDQLTLAVRHGQYEARYDLDVNGLLDNEDRRVWVEDLARTFYGDANLDLQFDSNDFVQAFQSGEYEDGIVANSTWGTGDWDGNGEFESDDFVLAFQQGAYEQGPRPIVPLIPEPTGCFLVLSGWALVVLHQRGKFSRRLWLATASGR